MMVGAVALAGCSPAQHAKAVRYASAEQVELLFRDKTFVLGDNNSVALVRPPDWPKGRWLKLRFWLGINPLVPRKLQPREGRYYVISEARLVKRLKQPGEWIIDAGSTLVKKEAIFVTSRTRYLTRGKILPTIVHFVGMRAFEHDGVKVKLPVLQEVSLPMKWTLGGSVPSSYAAYRLAGQLG